MFLQVYIIYITYYVTLIMLRKISVYMPTNIKVNCFGFNSSIIKLHFWNNMLSLFIALDILINVTVGLCACFFVFFVCFF